MFRRILLCKSFLSFYYRSSNWKDSLIIILSHSSSDKLWGSRFACQWPSLRGRLHHKSECHLPVSAGLQNGRRWLLREDVHSKWDVERQHAPMYRLDGEISQYLQLILSCVFQNCWAIKSVCARFAWIEPTEAVAAVSLFTHLSLHQRWPAHPLLPSVTGRCKAATLNGAAAWATAARPDTSFPSRLFWPAWPTAPGAACCHSVYVSTQKDGSHGEQRRSRS